MPNYFVHRYDVVRVKVAVEATDHTSAMERADSYLADHHPIPNRYLGGAGQDEALAEAVGLPTWLQIEEAGQAVTGYLVDDFDDPEHINSRSYGPSKMPEIDGSCDYDDFPRSDWRYDVANGDTSLGYAEWVLMNRCNTETETHTA